MDTRERFRGCLLGLATGDALGATLESMPRGSFEPLTDMVGGGFFGLTPGQWTDDTSMALCLAASLVECGRFDPLDQMNRYLRWRDEGYMSSTGRCFGMGGTVSSALQRFQITGDPLSGSTDPWSAGNGCIMRLAPVPMFYFPHIDAAEHFASESSRTTHGAQECVDACRFFARVICRALQGCTKEDVLLADQGQFSGAEKVVAIANGEYFDKSEEEMYGTGYVIQSLEAALWCFAKTDSFKDAVLKAVNLGDDADTTGAVCGQVAGAFYGASAIPPHWLEVLAMRDEIIRLADQLYELKPAEI